MKWQPKNWTQVELKLKNFKAQSSEIGVVVHPNKITFMNGEVNFLVHEFVFMSRLGKGELNY